MKEEKSSKLISYLENYVNDLLKNNKELEKKYGDNGFLRGYELACNHILNKVISEIKEWEI